MKGKPNNIISEKAGFLFEDTSDINVEVQQYDITYKLTVCRLWDIFIQFLGALSNTGEHLYFFFFSTGTWILHEFCWPE